MKKSIVFAIFISILVFSTACHKYEDGGYASKAHLKGTWNLETATFESTTSSEKETINFPLDVKNFLESLLAANPSDTILLGLIEDIEEFDASVKSIKFTFEKDGSGKFVVNVSGSGILSMIPPLENDFDWKFTDDKDYLEITFAKNTTGMAGMVGMDFTDIIPEKSKILKLTNKELWFTSAEDTEDVKVVAKLKKEKDN